MSVPARRVLSFPQLSGLGRIEGQLNTVSQATSRTGVVLQIGSNTSNQLLRKSWGR